MTERIYDTTQISRRKVLAGLGTIGVAAAGAGLGTSAYFSDQETFEGNQLVAGSLDMKVDWEEHYSDWSDDEAEFAEMADPATADYVLPAPLNSPDMRDIALNFVGAGSVAASQDAFWDVTSVEAYPDGFLNGGAQDGRQDAFDDEFACELLTDVPEPGLDSRLRTNGTFAGQTTESGDPLINIQDVKPGDFGEVTFSFHLCDNPGYVWMNGELVSWSEGEPAYTEAELDDPDEDGSATPTVDDIELLDEIQTRFWYDDGDNQLAIGDEPTDLAIVIDRSVSITEPEMDDLKAGVSAFMDALPNDPDLRAGVVTFGGNNVSIEQDIVQKSSFTFDANTDLPNSGSGNTPLPPALDIADQLLDDRNSGARKVIVTFTDGGPNYNNQSYSGSIGGDSFSAPRNGEFTADSTSSGYNEGSQSGTTGGISDGELAETAIVAERIRDGGSLGDSSEGTRIVVVAVVDPVDDDPEVATRNYLRDNIASKQGDYKDIQFDNIANAANALVVATLSEEVFLEASLREALEWLSGNEGRGIPLDGDTATQFNEIAAVSEGDADADALDNLESDPDRDCFTGEGTTHYVAMEWWLPINHGNQVQTDSVSFDLGFYTEQCRHNDGSGMVPEDAVDRVTLRSDPDDSGNSWITAQVAPGPVTRVTVELDDTVYAGWPANPNSYVMEVNIDADDDGLGEGQSDDFRFGYAGATSRANDFNATGPGGYLRRNTGTGSANRTDLAAEDVDGFTVTESGDQQSYTFVIDWQAIAADSDVPALSQAPSEIIVKEVYGSDGGNGVQITNVDSTTDPSGTLSTGL